MLSCGQRTQQQQAGSCTRRAYPREDGVNTLEGHREQSAADRSQACTGCCSRCCLPPILLSTPFLPGCCSAALCTLAACACCCFRMGCSRRTSAATTRATTCTAAGRKQGSSRSVRRPEEIKTQRYWRAAAGHAQRIKKEYTLTITLSQHLTP